MMLVIGLGLLLVAALMLTDVISRAFEQRIGPIEFMMGFVTGVILVAMAIYLNVVTGNLN